MRTFKTEDDVLTLLICLGYLAYKRISFSDSCIKIRLKEVEKRKRVSDLWKNKRREEHWKIVYREQCSWENQVHQKIYWHMI